MKACTQPKAAPRSHKPFREPNPILPKNALRRLTPLLQRAICSGFGVLVLLALSAAPTLAKEEASYTIQPGDVLSVSVWKETELQLTVIVRPDSGLSIPLVGDIVTRDKTVEELSAVIAERLSRYIPDPVVSVAVEEVRGNAFYVLGRVARPGEFILRRPTDVMQALSMAGGFTTYAKLNDIKILRRESGELTAISFRYPDVAEGENLEQNIFLESGDVIVVP